MSGSYIDAAGPTIGADMAAVASGVTAALTQNASGQSTAETFIAQHGAAVSNGHATVGYIPAIIVAGE